MSKTTVAPSVEIVASRRSMKAAENFIVASCGFAPGISERSRHWMGSGFTDYYDMTFTVERDGKDFHVVRTINPLP